MKAFGKLELYILMDRRPDDRGLGTVIMVDIFALGNFDVFAIRIYRRSFPGGQFNMT